MSEEKPKGKVGGKPAAKRPAKGSSSKTAQVRVTDTEKIESLTTRSKTMEEQAQTPITTETGKQGRAGYGEQIGAAGVTVKTGIVGSLRGVDEIEAEIVSLVRNTVSNTIKASGSVSGEAVNTVRDVVKGAIAATEEVGAGLVLASKSVAKGVVMGVADVGGDVIKAASETGRTAVRSAADVGGDVALVAKRTVDGVIEAARETGGNAAEVAIAAADGAVEAAGTISKTAVTTVRDVLLGIVGGVKDVASAALPKAPAPSRPEKG
jgi:hypothetical protein